MSIYYVLIGLNGGQDEWDQRRFALAYAFLASGDKEAEEYARRLVTSQKPAVVAAYRFVGGVPERMQVKSPSCANPLPDDVREAIRLERVSPNSWPCVKRDPLSDDVAIVALARREDVIEKLCRNRQLAEVADSMLTEGLPRSKELLSRDVSSIELTQGERLLKVMLDRQHDRGLGASLSEPFAVKQHFLELLSGLLAESLRKKKINEDVVVALTIRKQRRNE